MALTTVERVLAAREASHVTRCHTVPHHGEYSVGKHSHDALSLLFILHPDPSINLIKALHWHDGGERWLGDIPSPAKMYNPELKRVYEATEREALERWELDEGLRELNAEEGAWLRAIDGIELFIWCKEQEALGNRHVYTFTRTLTEYFKRLEMDGMMPPPCQEFLENYVWDRLPEMNQ